MRVYQNRIWLSKGYVIGDEVKHLDYISICFEIFRFTQDDKMKVDLCFNPSSLQSVGYKAIKSVSYSGLRFRIVLQH